MKRDDECPICQHEWRKHDPDNGMCDSHTSEHDALGVCLCGRDLVWMQKRIKSLSKAAWAA